MLDASREDYVSCGTSGCARLEDLQAAAWMRGAEALHPQPGKTDLLARWLKKAGHYVFNTH